MPSPPAAPHRVRLALALALATATAAATPAPADETPVVRLSYERGEGAEICPAEDALVRGVRDRLGYDPFRRDATTSINVTLRRSGKVFKALISVDDHGTRGRRELASEKGDCDELAHATALALAVVIDPISAGRAEPPAPNASSAPAASGSAPSVVATASAPGPPPTPSAPVERRPRVEIGLPATLAVGTEPAAAVGLAPQLGLVTHTASLSIEARGELPAARELAGVGRVVGQRYGVAFVGCWRPSRASACGVVFGGAMHGRGELDHPSTATTGYVAAGLRVGYEQPIGGAFAVAAALEGLVPITHTTLRIDGRTGWSNPAVTGAVLIGPLARF